jgi:hypothetical protein
LKNIKWNIIFVLLDKAAEAWLDGSWVIEGRYILHLTFMFKLTRYVFIYGRKDKIKEIKENKRDTNISI